MRKIIKIFIFFFICSIWSIIASDLITVSQTKSDIYSSVSELPENKVWLLLGTSKYTSGGRRNLFYLYRIRAAHELYENEKIEYILVSGDNSTQQYNETDTMVTDLIELWVPEEKIYGDYAGFRTLDSVIRAREIFGQSEYTIISQEFHLQRAVFIAKQKWIDAVGFAARDVPVWLAPRVWIRERLARVKMMIDIIFQIKPKFLGEEIEIGN